jgi:hypothetical protein
VLPDVLPPDWDALERELAEEIEDGATRIMLMAGDAGTLDTHGERLTMLVSELEAEGVAALVVWQDEESLAVSV